MAPVLRRQWAISRASRSGLPVMSAKSLGENGSGNVLFPFLIAADILFDIHTEFAETFYNLIDNFFEFNVPADQGPAAPLKVGF